MDPFATRKVGRTSVAVTQLGFGGAPIGELYERMPEDQAINAVRAAWDAGIRYFDTAPFYGSGLSEVRVGHVLRQHSRRDYVLSTKVGRYLLPEDAENIDRGRWKGGLDFKLVMDYSYDATMRSVEQSMHRMGISRFDMLYIHDVDVFSQGSREAFEQRFKEAMEGAYPALDKLRSEGLVKGIGVGINEAEACTMFARAGDFDCFLLAGRYTLLEQEALDDFLPLAEEKNIGILLGGPYNSGILATGAVEGAYYNYYPAPPEILDRVSRIEAVCRRHRVALPAAAIQFPLGHPSVASIIPGAISAHEVRQNVDLMNASIPSDLWAELKHEGLMRPDAPTP